MQQLHSHDSARGAHQHSTLQISAAIDLESKSLSGGARRECAGRALFDGSVLAENNRMTSLLDATLALLLAAIVNFVVVTQIRARAAVTERYFLVRVYSSTVLLRCILAIALNIFAEDLGFAMAFWGDSGQYDYGANQLALKWSGEPVLSPHLAGAISGYGWVHFVAAIYYVFGQNQLLVQLFNGVIGGLTVLVIYAIGKDLFDREAARWAALFMAFFPQMVFWSAGMYKDPAVLFCIATAMYAVLQLRQRFELGSIIMFVSAILALMTLRFYIAYFVGFAAVGTFVFAQRRGLIGNLVVFAILTASLLGALRFVVQQESLDQQRSYLTLERLQITRSDQAHWGQSGYGQEYDVSTPAGALAALPVGLVYLLFAPFPWAVTNLRQVLTLPETLVWYALMPAFIRGVRYAIRRRFKDVLPVLVFTLSLTLAYVLMQGNIGTAYRQRTQVSMFFFIFMGMGLVEKQRQRPGRKGASGILTPSIDPNPSAWPRHVPPRNVGGRG